MQSTAEKDSPLRESVANQLYSLMRYVLCTEEKH